MWKKKLKRMIRFNKKKYSLILSFVIIVFLFSIGYAAIRTDLSINGTSYLSSASWDVHFDNIQTIENSVTPSTAPTISNNTSISFAVTLEEPGDFYGFTADVVNGGSIDAMIDSFVMTPTLTSTQAKYLEYVVTYSDGIQIANKQKLDAGVTETIKVLFRYKTSDDKNDYPTEDQTFTMNVTLNYVQQEDDAINVLHPSTFADDDWETIVLAVQNGNTSAYNVGDTKEIDMGSLGTHTLRIANKSTPAECSNAGFSQTACGFVLEFADIITNHRMNPYDNPGVENGQGTKGSWQYSEMRTFVNNDVYNSLPSDLKSSIINTVVVTGKGYTDTANCTTEDKLYLPAAHEVYEEYQTYYPLDYYDDGYNYTRQFDYYLGLNVTTTDYASARKQFNSAYSIWWLRTPNTDGSDMFYTVSTAGSYSVEATDYAYGVSPAFRIG